MNFLKRLALLLSNKKKQADDKTTSFNSEELWPWHNPAYYLPIELGQKVNGRYLVIGKLGYGSVSTVWLCQDTKNRNAWVVLKVYVSGHRQAQNEVKMYKHMERFRKDDPRLSISGNSATILSFQVNTDFINV
jgi:serine/threonine-protein kinase SRPK3